MFLGLGVAKFSVWCGVEEPGPGEWHFPTRVSSLWPCVWTSRVFLQEQIQNVFKRVSSYRAALWWCQTDALFVSITSFYFALQFLFHYSKAHNSVGSVEREVWVSHVTVFWCLIKLGSLTTNNHHFWPLLYMNMLFSPCLQSHSVHPLMRLSPKLSLRRKKQVWRQFSLGCCYCLWDARLKAGDQPRILIMKTLFNMIITSAWKYLPVSFWVTCVFLLEKLKNVCGTPGRNIRGAWKQNHSLKTEVKSAFLTSKFA